MGYLFGEKPNTALNPRKIHNLYNLNSAVFLFASSVNLYARKLFISHDIHTPPHNYRQRYQLTFISAQCSCVTQQFINNWIGTSNNVGGVGKERNKAFTLLLGFVKNDSSADSVFWKQRESW